MKKSEILQELADCYGYNIENLSSKKLQDLKDLLAQHQQYNNEELIDDENIEIVEEDSIITSDEKTVSFFDENWTETILDGLRESEKVDGFPKVDGLRRLVEENIGAIQSYKTEVIQPPSSMNNNTATVISTIVVLVQSDVGFMEYSGTADASKFNTKPPYDNHLTAVAETRAEGRALRKLLRLQSVVTAEEVQSGMSDLAGINDGQILFIDRLCKNESRGMNINVEKLIKTQCPKVKSIRSVSHSEAIEINGKLNEYQQKLDSIPEELVGYDSSWKDSFK